VTVVGYATNESPEHVPQSLAYARRIAKRLEELRNGDDTWFWLGADGEVVVGEGAGKQVLVSIHVEHGAKPLAEARDAIEAVVKQVVPEALIKTNELGPNEARGLAHVMGASGRQVMPYGELLPAARLVGMDVRRAEKAGAWLARAAARQLVEAGSSAAMVTASYLPGEDLPARITARDGQGKDISQQIVRDTLSLKRVMNEWWRPGLNVEAMRWGFAGEAGLPWES